MRLANPEALLLFFLIPFILEKELYLRFVNTVFGRFSKRPSETGAISFCCPLELDEISPGLRAKLRAWFLSLIRALCFSCLVLALTRPQAGSIFQETEASGRDIIFVLDISGSMQGLDFRLDGNPLTRLDALKHVVKKFISARLGDRMALVVFGDQAFTQCPLTLDHETLHNFIDYIEVGMAGQGTAIGDAIAVGLKRARDIEAESKVIVLVTDGKSNAGALKPEQAAKVAEKLNVKIHTVGIGKTGRVPFQQVDRRGRKRTTMQQLEYDGETLKKISEITGGEYFNARNLEQLQAVYKEIDKLEQRTDKTYRHVNWQEKFMLLAVSALGLLVICELLAASIFFKIP